MTNQMVHILLVKIINPITMDMLKLTGPKWWNGQFFFIWIEIWLVKNDQSNGPYFASQNNQPNHNGHVEINLSKMMEWSFWQLFKFNIYLLDLRIKKVPCFLIMQLIHLPNFSTCLITYIPLISYLLQVIYLLLIILELACCLNVIIL